jgi:hypothetical protein
LDFQHPLGSFVQFRKEFVSMPPPSGSFGFPAARVGLDFEQPRVRSRNSGGPSYEHAAALEFV